MYMSRISRDEAEDIIVNGQGNGFSQIVLLGNLFTIYHRFYDNEYWDVVEVTYNFIDDYGDEQQSVVFYILDSGEVIDLLGFNPKEVLVDDLMMRGLI